MRCGWVREYQRDIRKWHVRFVYSSCNCENWPNGATLPCEKTLAVPLISIRTPFHDPIVAMSVKAPVAASMLYMETSFEAEFVT